MDQVKIGTFLKELRNGKGITQEQLADRFYVSRRTVSRWETGSNLPDLDVLVELADFYDVDLRDIFNGQRREDNMDNELKDTLLQAADYTQEVSNKITKRMNVMFVFATAAMVLYLVAVFALPDIDTGIWGFLKGMALGVSLGMLVIGIILTSPLHHKIVEWKAGKTR